MVDLITLTNAYIEQWRLIPELVAELDGDAANIAAYIDLNPETRSHVRAVYTQKPGTVLLAWFETVLNEGEISGWRHRHQISVRAQRGHSELIIIYKLIEGVPVPGNDLRWRDCSVMPAVYSADIVGIARITDEEGIDYFVITMETRETGDAK